MIVHALNKCFSQNARVAQRMYVIGHAPDIHNKDRKRKWQGCQGTFPIWKFQSGFGTDDHLWTSWNLTPRVADNGNVAVRIIRHVRVYEFEVV